MYGTVYRIRPKPGQERFLEEHGQRWLRERAPLAEGFIAEYVLQPETRPNEWLGLVIFDSEENYRENAADPGQQRWYEQFRAALTVDPEWNDGEIVAREQASVPL
jgi:hypothetical protein